VAVVSYDLVSHHVEGFRLCGCLASLAGIIALQWLHWAIGADRLRPCQRAAILSAIALLTCLPPLAFHAMWEGMGGFLMGSVLTLTQFPASGLLALMVATGAAATSQWLLGGDRGISGALQQAIVTTLAGLAILGLHRLGTLPQRARDTTDSVVATAVAREQLRFSRDLHDLLGHTLSVITLKSELACRLADKQPARVQQELEDVVKISRQVLADVRALARGYHTMSLKRELESAVSALESVGRAVTLDIRADVSPSALPSDAVMVLSAVLREGVTNVLRHSSGRQCRIRLEECQSSIVLAVWSDGPVRPAVASGTGAGLGNLAARMDAIGGCLEVSSGEDWFALTARTPPVEIERGDRIGAVTISP
jgi:two-component system sensor histidine kinase DesK